MIAELKPEQLRWQCGHSECDFESTADVEPLGSIIGQDRALRAIELGLRIDDQGYNLYVAGMPGSGRNTSLKLYLDELAPGMAPPADWCYLRNFEDEYHPLAIELPAATGPRFARLFDQALGHAVDEISRSIESDDHARSRDAHVKAVAAERQKVMDEVEKRGREWGFLIQTSEAGVQPRPVNAEGKPLTAEDFAALSEAERKVIEGHAAELSDLIKEAFLQLRGLDRRISQQLLEMDDEAALESMTPIFDELKEQLARENLGTTSSYLEPVMTDLVDQLHEIRAFDQPLAPNLPPDREQRRERFLDRYRVNVFATNDGQGAPVVFENNATYYNVFGRADYRSVGGAMVTDHRQIQPGSLHRANGGFLVLQAPDVFSEHGIWETLKRNLRSGEIHIEAMGEQARAVPVQSISPQPIPLTGKIIVIGTPGVYQLAWSNDEDFRKLFKVKADFAPDMDRTPESVRHMASFVRRRSDKLGMPGFDRQAIARVIEYSARLAGHQEKLSTRFVDLADIVTEAAYWHTRRSGGGMVGGEDVERAIKEKDYRNGLYEDRLQRMIDDGIIHISTDSQVVGQVNGLSVYELADFSFGRPNRITARVSLGEGELLNLERETELSGRIHNKGFLSLVGYLQGKYGASRPLAFSASIGFEQIYDEVEGDSAASAELYALLSALAEVPLRQDIAVTGSVNQFGAVQAVGGVVDKVEGFFEVCRAAGLNGTQGVMLPTDNVKNLMLNDEVVEAVETGQFHVWPVKTIDQGIEILTGIQAGVPNAKGVYPARSLHGRVVARLEAMLEKQREYATPPEAERPPARAAGPRKKSAKKPAPKTGSL